MIELTLPYPISANRYWASRVIRSKTTGKPMALTYVTPEANAYKDEVRRIARAVGIVAPLKGRVDVRYELYPHRPLDWRRRMARDPLGWADTVQCIDLGNAEKVMSDALNGVVIDDDGWTHRLYGDRVDPDERPARLVVRIQSLAKAAHPQLALPVDEPVPTGAFRDPALREQLGLLVAAHGQMAVVNAALAIGEPARCAP